MLLQMQHTALSCFQLHSMCRVSKQHRIEGRRTCVLYAVKDEQAPQAEPGAVLGVQAQVADGILVCKARDCRCPLRWAAKFEVNLERG